MEKIIIHILIFLYVSYIFYILLMSFTYVFQQQLKSMGACPSLQEADGGAYTGPYQTAHPASHGRPYPAPDDAASEAWPSYLRCFCFLCKCFVCCRELTPGSYAELRAASLLELIKIYKIYKIYKSYKI